MEEWKEFKYTDLCSLIGGGTPKTSEPSYWGGNIPWLSVKDFGNDAKYVYTTEKTITEAGLNNSSTKLLKRDDIIISARGTIGAIAMLASEMAFNQSCFGIRSNDLVEQHYLYYLTKTKINELQKNSHGSVFDTITRDTFAKIDCAIPSIATQTKISRFLSSLDDKIELNRKINANLEAQAQALFKSWFVDFEPFKDQPFVESELGMIPEGWKVGTFLDNVNVMPGGTPSTNKTEYWTGGTIPFFSPKDVNGVYCFKTEKNITELGLNNCSSHLYPKDTLFITARGTVGKLALAGLPMAMNQSNYALVAKEGISKFYLYLLAQTLVSVLLKKANGAVFSAITTRDFNEPTIIPPTLDIKHFDNLVSPIFNKIYQTEQESRRLASLRDALLPRLMSGELKVNEIVL